MGSVPNVGITSSTSILAYYESLCVVLVVSEPFQNRVGRDLTMHPQNELER